VTPQAGDAFASTNRTTWQEAFVGARLGAAEPEVSPKPIAPPSPPVISERGTLRFGLPGVYQDSDFTMRFVGALERVLDPVGAILDGLHHYVDPDLAPVEVLRLLCAWLGVEEGDEDRAVERTQEQLRQLVKHASVLSRWRGTQRGLELALALEFPDLPFRIEDHGGIGIPDEPVQGGIPRFVVYCDTPVPEPRRTEIDRFIAREKPAHVAHRLRVKRAKEAA
jgi:phage tail-like protein